MDAVDWLKDSLTERQAKSQTASTHSQADSKAARQPDKQTRRRQDGQTNRLECSPGRKAVRQEGCEADRHTDSAAREVRHAVRAAEGHSRTDHDRATDRVCRAAVSSGVCRGLRT